MSDEVDEVKVRVGQVWESTESRDKGRQVRVISLDDAYANCAGVSSNRATRLEIARMNLRGHWKLVGHHVDDGAAPATETTTTGTEDAPRFSDSDGESFEPAIPFHQQRQLVAVTSEFMVDSVALSLAPGRKPTHESFSETAKKLATVHKGVAFWIGDMYNLGESLFGEEMSQHIDELGLDEKSVGVYGWVSAHTPEENRRIAPSFSHAQVTAAMKPAQQRKWLEKAVENDWSVAKLKQEITKAGEGRSSMRFLLIVDCGTEAKQEKLQKQLEVDGFGVTTRSGLKRDKKAKKARRAKKGEVTARGRRPKKMNQRQRVPTGPQRVH